MNDVNVEQVKNTTFLGIIIDECLTWNDHITNVSKKLLKASGIIAKIRHFLNRNAIELIYYALFIMHLLSISDLWQFNLGYTMAGC
jgi:flagellin-specific chaperone FliS